MILIKECTSMCLRPTPFAKFFWGKTPKPSCNFSLSPLLKGGRRTQLCGSPTKHCKKAQFFTINSLWYNIVSDLAITMDYMSLVCSAQKWKMSWKCTCNIHKHTCSSQVLHTRHVLPNFILFQVWIHLMHLLSNCMYFKYLGLVLRAELPEGLKNQNFPGCANTSKWRDAFVHSSTELHSLSADCKVQLSFGTGLHASLPFIFPGREPCSWKLKVHFAEWQSHTDLTFKDS